MGQVDTSILTNTQVEKVKEVKPKRAVAPKQLVVKQTRVGIYEIGYDTGGGTPKELGGEWTKMRMALTAIANYESRIATNKAGK